MTERELTARIVKEIRDLGGKVIQTHTHGQRQKRAPVPEHGTPDLLGCFCWEGERLDREFIAIEVKVDGNKLTDIEAQRLREWADAGAAATVAREDFDFTGWLAHLGWGKEEFEE